jgi:hypothetical protein
MSDMAEMNEAAGTGAADLGFERIAGIREDLPRGERVLWQGAPTWRSMALRAFHVREVAIYFLLLSTASCISALADGRPASTALLPAGLGLLACALLMLLAWLTSRTTIYAITTGRVFLRIGIALPLSVNLPLRRIESADLALRADGSGDLALRTEPGAHLAWLHLWPHTRPWRVRRTEPMIRGIDGAEPVAHILAQALRGVHEAAASSERQPEPALAATAIRVTAPAPRRFEAARA